MSIQNDSLRPPPDNKLALSSLIRRTMVRAVEREQERSKLISVLILAQFLLTAITTAGYISSPMMIPAVFLGLVALVVYCCAYVSTRLFRRSGAAAYILVIGGGLAIAGQTLVLALGGQPLQAGQAALLFVAIILESGLLFSPEITLLTAFSTTVIAAFAVLLGLSNDHSIARSEAYFSVAFTLGLLALTALISWLLSQYIFETSLEAQRGQELQFAQARLEALSNQTEDHHRLLDESVAELLQTISRVLGGDYMVRAEIPESELTPLGESLNLLFQRYESTTHAELMRSRMDAGVLPMIESITRMPDTNTPTPNSLPIMTNTPLDSVSLVLRQMQANLNQRLGRVQRLAGEVVSSLGHSQEPLSDALNTVNEAQRMAGALIADAEKVLDTTRRQLDRIFTARRMLSSLLPEEITRADITAPRTSTGELTGLGPDLGMGSSGYTGQFGTVSSLGSILEGDSTDSIESGIARMTQPLTSISPAFANEQRDSMDAGDSGGESVSSRRGRGNRAIGAGSLASGASGGGTAGDLPPELVETWNLITQIDAEMRQSERLLSKLESQLGTQSRQLRTVDTNIAWFRSALQAMLSNAEQLQHIAGLPLQMPGADSPVTPASPSRPLSQLPGFSDNRLPFPVYGEAGPGGSLEDPNTGASDSGGMASGDESMHAPGSLRASDLLSFDSMDFSSLGETNPADKERPDGD